jgi:acyl-CoA reductase-like NAD-dependent aldehyde dehydrogenase
VVGVIAPDTPSLSGLIAAVAPVLVGGNAVVALVSEKIPLPAMTLAEHLATSDFPGGIINLLSGRREELASTFASHMDVQALVEASGDPATRDVFQQQASSNVKRIVLRDRLSEEPHAIGQTVEMKTAWHPIGF